MSFWRAWTFNIFYPSIPRTCCHFNMYDFNQESIGFSCPIQLLWNQVMHNPYVHCWTVNLLSTTVVKFEQIGLIVWSNHCFGKWWCLCRAEMLQHPLHCLGSSPGQLHQAVGWNRKVVSWLSSPGLLGYKSWPMSSLCLTGVTVYIQPASLSLAWFGLHSTLTTHRCTAFFADIAHLYSPLFMLTLVSINYSCFK